MFLPGAPAPLALDRRPQPPSASPAGVGGVRDARGDNSKLGANRSSSWFLDAYTAGRRPVSAPPLSALRLVSIFRLCITSHRSRQKSATNAKSSCLRASQLAHHQFLLGYVARPPRAEPLPQRLLRANDMHCLYDEYSLVALKAHCLGIMAIRSASARTQGTC